MRRHTSTVKWMTATLLAGLAMSPHAEPVQWRGEFVYFADSLAKSVNGLNARS